MDDMEQKNARVDFHSKGVRPESIFGLRWALDVKGIEEGEFLSQLFDKAVVEIYNGNEAMVEILHSEYLERLKL